jgi:hypothetical protein
MFLLLLCLGTILAPSYPASCQPRCSLPPSSGSVRAASFHLFSRSMTAPTRFCAVAPTPSPSESGHGFFSSTDTKQSRNRFPTRRGGFCTPGTSSAFTTSTDALPVPSMGTAQGVRPLTFSPPSRGQSWGGAVWRATYSPGDGQTSLAYPSHPVQYLYINRYVTVNKLVLSYLLLRLLLQYDYFEYTVPLKVYSEVLII